MCSSLSRFPFKAVLALFFTLILWSASSEAIPVFARQYEMSCATCHSAFPRLNSFGEAFRDSNYRLPNWREKIAIDTGDEMLALPKFPQLAIRAQAYVQSRQAREINDTYTGFTDNNASRTDFQSPYLIKLLSSAPLSDHLTYYFYGIYAEKGSNGTAVIEDAWFRHDDAFGTGIGTMLGQFQVSDLMFPRETRMTFQDFMVYRFADITYQRGVIFDRNVGPLKLSLGAVNGNGTEVNYNLNSPGYLRPDAMFDNNNRKDLFGRIGGQLGPLAVGVFGLNGKQASIDNVTPALPGMPSETLGLNKGTREVNKSVRGIDLSGHFSNDIHWFAQGLWTRWYNFLDSDPARDFNWFGGFAGIDYIHSPRWSYSLLYNYANANDLNNTGTIYEGINMKTLTFTASYYFARNAKGIIELNGDLQKADPYNFAGHASKEGYLLLGFDAAF